MKLNLFFGFLILTQTLFAQTFTEANPAPEFDGVWLGVAAFADVDGDNDQDVLITGLNNSSERVVKLYTNDGMGNFVEKVGNTFFGWTVSSFAFSDVDGDDDEDLLMTGEISLQERTKLYINDGMGNFTEQIGDSFFGVEGGSVAFSDLDGDNDQDLLITGNISNGSAISQLYTNDGMGNFTEVMGGSIEGVRKSSIAFTDVDADSDQDLFITGVDITGEHIAQLYTNDGMGNFTEVMGTSFEGVWLSSIAFSDVDGDNDQDLLITGETNNFEALITKLYTNDGMGNFTEELGLPFDGVGAGSIAFSDVDGDSDPDLLISGDNGLGEAIAKLYINDGMGNFTEEPGTPFDGVAASFIVFSDVDGDNDEDLLITGLNTEVEQIAKLYINNGNVSSTDGLFLGFNLDFSSYPNPIKSNMLNVIFDSTENGLTMVKVFDLNGHLLSQQNEFLVYGQKIISVDIASLSPGSYFIQLENGKRKGVAKFIVQ
jgi:hypothetical protein